MANWRSWRLREDLQSLSTESDSSDEHAPIANEWSAERDSNALELQHRAEWQLACRVANSGGFSKSKYLRRFLLYVCELHLLGRTDEIVEQRIGSRIFGRAADYDPGGDNIVRSYARMLRKRLDAYFDEEGAEEPIRITIQRGGYVPVFEARSSARKPVVAVLRAPFVQEIPTEAVAESHLEVTDRQEESGMWRRRFRLNLPSVILGLVGGLVVATGGWWVMQVVHARSMRSPAHVLWTQLFQPNRNTLIVVADSGFGILQNLSRHPVGVDEYVNGTFRSLLYPGSGLDEGNFNDLSQQRYTSIVNLDVAAALVRLPEYLPLRTQIRFARSVTAEDIKNSNVILIGSKHSDPWVSLFEKKLNFRLEYTPQVDDSYVLNEHLEAGEQKIYHNGAHETGNHTYGTVAYLPGLDGRGHVLIIQGLDMAATQAAADVLLRGTGIASVLNDAAHADGSLRPFEVLVETTSIGAANPGADIVARRVYGAATIRD